MSWNALVGQVSDVVLEESTKSKWCHDPATNRTGEEVSPSREGRFVEVWDHISTLHVSLLQRRLGRDLANRDGTAGVSPIRACGMKNGPRPSGQSVLRKGSVLSSQPMWNP
jgi:hypothetical protein